MVLAAVVEKLAGLRPFWFREAKAEQIKSLPTDGA